LRGSFLAAFLSQSFCCHLMLNKTHHYCSHKKKEEQGHIKKSVFSFNIKFEAKKNNDQKFFNFF